MARLSSQTMALRAGRPVRRCTGISVSPWAEIPIAATRARVDPGMASRSWTAAENSLQ